MKKQLITLLVLLLFVGVGHAQKFFKGTIKMDDGTLKSGLVVIPDMPSIKNVSF
ncbi:hypothetical protein QWY31_05730 [Cytophagales bacterium LB-30]|uniref:Uncharacterized protein n=2 Tax=Shiella aurantiaca TaxID=3058365 RepID=A0ABT8F3G3_9BACT|nr:hypothetical protein [Shiella aurantiaca]